MSQEIEDKLAEYFAVLDTEQKLVDKRENALWDYKRHLEACKNSVTSPMSRS